MALFLSGRYVRLCGTCKEDFY